MSVDESSFFSRGGAAPLPAPPDRGGACLAYLVPRTPRLEPRAVLHGQLGTARLHRKPVTENSRVPRKILRHQLSVAGCQNRSRRDSTEAILAAGNWLPRTNDPTVSAKAAILRLLSGNWEPVTQSGAYRALNTAPLKTAHRRLHWTPITGNWETQGGAHRAFDTAPLRTTDYRFHRTPITGNPEV